MRLGCYGSLERIGPIHAAGFDYLETSVQLVLRGDEPSRVWDAQAPDPDQLPLPVEVACDLLPADRVIVGSRRESVELQNYLQRVAKRAQRLGIRCLMFGSGPVLQEPTGFDPSTAWQHLDEFIQMAGEICAHHGVMVVVEPTEAGPAGTVSSLEQATLLCDRLEHPAVGVGVDCDQFIRQHESDDAVIKLAHRLKIVHMSLPGDTLRHQVDHDPTSSEQGGAKRSPLANQGSDNVDLEYFLCVLRKTGYEGRVTLRPQLGGEPTPEVASLLRCWRTIWARTGQFEG